MNIHQDGDNLSKMSPHAGLSKKGTGPMINPKYNTILYNESLSLYKMDLKQVVQLLSESLYFINQVPNKKYKTFTGEESYELAAKINKFLTSL